MGKCEYLTGEDLGLKPSTIEQTKFEYFPLGKIFNKGFDENDKKEGLFRRLKNFENAQRNKVNSKIKDNEDNEDQDKKTTTKQQ